MAIVLSLDAFKEPKGAIKIVIFILELMAFAAVASWSKFGKGYEDIDGGKFFMFVHVTGWLLMGLIIFIYGFLLQALLAKVSFYYSIEFSIQVVWAILALISSAVFAREINKLNHKDLLDIGPMEFGIAMGFIAFITFLVACYYSYKEIIAAGGFQGSVKTGSAAPAPAGGPAAPAPSTMEGETTVPF